MLRRLPQDRRLDSCPCVSILATLEIVDGVTDEYLAAASSSMDEPQLAEFEHNVRSTYKQMVRISIEPLWARFYDFGAGRLPGFLANLVSDS